MKQENLIQVCYKDIVESNRLGDPTPPRVYVHSSAEFSACRLQRMLADVGIGIVVEVDDAFPKDAMWFVPLDAVKKMMEEEAWS